MATILIIISGALLRLLPHWPNFTPINGLALFSGAKVKGKMAFFFPLLTMLVSDLFLGMHIMIPFVYGSFMIAVLLGRQLKSKSVTLLPIYSLLSSCLFFLITNFGVWVATDMYPKTVNGLFDCYLMGLPFFRNTVLGDLFYSFVFFFGYSLIAQVIQKIRIKFSRAVIKN